MERSLFIRTVMLTLLLRFFLPEAKQHSDWLMPKTVSQLKMLCTFRSTSRRENRGEIKVAYFPDGQLGGERELVELIQANAVDITKVSSGLMESFSPSVRYFFPYRIF